MHTFTKTRSETNPFEHEDIEIRVDNDEITLDDIVKSFEGYLLACGYRFPRQHLEIVSDDEGGEA